MTMAEVVEAKDVRALRYVERRSPIDFPEAEKVPESQLHFDLRVTLYELLRDELGQEVTVGSDQFMYLDAEDPKQSLAPDVYVRLTPATDKVRSWKVWERGAPELAVEIISESDAPETPWGRKLERYRRLGVRELVRFDSESEPALRIWDRVDGALTERVVEGERAPCLVLGLDWVVAPADGAPRALRIARGPALIPTLREARDSERQAKEAERRSGELERRAREAAERRVRELEAELSRRG